MTDPIAMLDHMEAVATETGVIDRVRAADLESAADDPVDVASAA
jgi:hypothetical protein